jgi:hypothetical protein
MKQRALVLGGLWLAISVSTFAACGPKVEPQAAEPVPVASETTAAPAAPTTTASVEAPAPTPAPAASSAEPPPPAAPSIHDVCFAMCDKVKAKCAKSAFEACRVNCGKYDPPPGGCGDVVLAALSCARDAADLVCANVAPESCAKPFRQIAACASGQKPVADSDPATTALPAGFASYDNSAEGVHAPMPQGAAPGEGDVIVTAKHEGAVYSVRKLPRPQGKLNEKVFLKIGMNLFGRCSDKMKMQGMVDKPGRTSINYTTKCPDGSAEQGLFWATDKVLFVASVKGEPGKLGPAEAFLYGFEAK